MPASIRKEGEQIGFIDVRDAKAFPRINPRSQRQEDVTIRGTKGGFTVFDGEENIGYSVDFRFLGRPFTTFELTEGRTAVAVSKR